MQSHYYKERTHYGRIGCEDYIGGFRGLFIAAQLQQGVLTAGSSDWSFGRDRGHLETVLDLSDSWRGDSVISPMDTLYQEQTAGSKHSGLQGTAALCVG